MTTPQTLARQGLGVRTARLLDLSTIAGATIAVLLLRVLYGLVAVAISAMFPQTPLEAQVDPVPGSAPAGAWLQRTLVQPWLRYDAWNYLRIIDHGYTVEEGTAAFHPLYPLLAWPLAWLTGNQLLALLLASTLASIALAVTFARYVARRDGQPLAQRAGWLLLLSPPSFILLAPYNESLFLALAVGALWATQTNRWWVAGLLGGLAALTRQQGLALFLPLLWCVGLAARQRSTSPWNILAAMLVPAGYGLFIVYRAIALGDLAHILASQGPAEFVRNLMVSSSSEQVVVGQRIAWPWEPFIAELQLIAATGDYALIIDFALGWAGIAVVLAGLRSMDAAERLYALTVVALSLCYYNGDLSPYLSLPRHILLIFPLYTVLARWLGAGRPLRLYLEVAGMLNLFLAAAFVRRGWVP